SGREEQQGFESLGEHWCLELARWFQCRVPNRRSDTTQGLLLSEREAVALELSELSQSSRPAPSASIGLEYHSVSSSPISMACQPSPPKSVAIPVLPGVFWGCRSRR